MDLTLICLSRSIQLKILGKKDGRREGCEGTLQPWPVTSTGNEEKPEGVSRGPAAGFPALLLAAVCALGRVVAPRQASISQYSPRS